MLVKLSPSSLRRTSWQQYAVRFVLGGAATALAGWIGARFGTSVGGLFLALPAILCASATLIERHERRAKEKAGFDGIQRGRQAAALDAAGAGLASFGLMAFAAVFSLVVPTSVPGAFAVAMLAWAVVSVSTWWGRRKLRPAHHRARRNSAVRRSVSSLR